LKIIQFTSKKGKYSGGRPIAAGKGKRQKPKTTNLKPHKKRHIPFLAPHDHR
jgi:hypothetical protein